jgi:two-component system, OmpR family, phosphate regulon response regulator PhoB
VRVSDYAFFRFVILLVAEQQRMYGSARTRQDVADKVCITITSMSIREAIMRGSILVVDADAAMRKLVAGNFQNAGYQVICASDFAQAEVAVRDNRPELALLDWDPGLPGLTFTRQLRRDRRTASISIIMIGRRSDEQDTIAALESGADDYVRKPFSMRELLARVRAVLRRRTPELAEEVLEVHGLQLDPAARRLTAHGRDVDLRKTEFKLLHFFMTHLGRTFTRRELLDRVWGDNVYVEERTVDVHVRRLRRTLKPDHSALVETVRGVGYRMPASPPSTTEHQHPWTVGSFASPSVVAVPANRERVTPVRITEARESGLGAGYAVDG